MAQYWGLPPEVNSIRLMTGPGAAAMTGMISAYTAAGVTHVEQAGQMSVNAAASATGWQGLGGAAMMASVMPKIEWHTEAGAHAATAAELLGQAAVAHSTAMTMTIPYPVVVANRMREAALQASNILGQNTPAIIESNVEYGEFWSQNASAMTAYQAAGTAIATALSVPLRPPMLTSNPAAGIGAFAGLGAQLAQTGLQGAMEAASAPAEVAGQAASAAAPAVLSAATSATSSGTGSPQATGQNNAPSAPASQPGNNDMMMSVGQSLMGTASSAPQMLSSLGSPLSQSPISQFGGQLSSLMGPAMSGMGGSPSTAGIPAGAPGANLASAMSGASGGYSGGGAPISAALTKTAAGGPVGLPGAWWGPAANASENGLTDKAVAARAGTGSTTGSAMGPMMMPAAAAAKRTDQHVRACDDTALSISVPQADAIPILTSGGMVYADGGG